jgi:acetyl-CoA C-acetyltransferase
MSEVVITGAARTPIGRLNGGLSSLPAHLLGALVIEEVLKRSNVKPEEVSEVVLGQVLTAGAGQNPARQAAMAAGIPVEVTAYGINQVCGSGLRAVALGSQAIRLGDAKIVVAGGQESMSQARHAAHLRSGISFGDAKLVDTMITDGLWDAFNDYHMGITGENVAARWKVSRETQDEFAARSQQRAAAAQADGRFDDEIVSIKISGKKGDIWIKNDEGVRPDTAAEVLAGLRPAFQKEGTVTAGNASGINDGAAAVLLMSSEEAGRRKIAPMARVVSWATRGVDPAVMGIAPVSAVREALDKAGWELADVDLIEANEAFAAQTCAVGKELGLDPNKLNVNGGAIALGHPIGASGARILVTLLFEMKRRNVHRGIATLCIGGGMGIALCVER